MNVSLYWSTYITHVSYNINCALSLPFSWVCFKFLYFRTNGTLELKQNLFLIQVVAKALKLTVFSGSLVLERPTDLNPVECLVTTACYGMAPIQST